MKKFAFLVHPRLSAKEDMGKVFPIFFHVPEFLLRKFIISLNPIVGGKVTFPDKKEVMGWIMWVPLVAEQIYSLDREFVVGKIIKAVEKARNLGAERIGLGELTSPITRGGESLLGKVKGVSITTGNSLTAGVIFKAVQKIRKIKQIDFSQEKVAVVGAAGSVGRAASLLLAEENIPLLLVDRSEKIKKLQDEMSGSNNIEFMDNLSLVKEAKIVVVATSSTEQVITAENLKQGAIIYDITQPRNVSASILDQRKDVTIIDWGIVNTPGIDYGVDIGLKKEQAYACLVETMLCALSEDDKNYTGYADPILAKKMLELMGKYKYFNIDNFQSFGKEVSLL